MNRQITAALITAILGAGMTAAGQGPASTAFTYQGQLKQLGAAVDDVCDFEFRLFDALTGGTQIGPTLTFDGVGGNVAAVNVVAGLFTVKLDFGVGVFTGDARFLEIRVRCPSGAGVYHLLNPRQPICAAPYALFALDSPPDFNLPLAVTIPLDQDLLSLTNSMGGASGGGALVGQASGSNPAVRGVALGDGNAGRFESFVGGSTADVLSVFTTSDGAGVNSQTQGGGSAGVFVNGAASNGATALESLTIGTGRAAHFHLNNPDSSSVAVEVTSNAADAGLYSRMTGTGDAGLFEIAASDPAANISRALTALTNGAGGAGSFRIEADDPAGNGADALIAATNGAGSAGAFNIIVSDPATNVESALRAFTNGRGRAGQFTIDEPTNPESALEAVTIGSGNAGRFEISVPDPGASLNPALYALTNGSGSAGAFQTGQPAAAPFASTATVFGANYRTDLGTTAAQFVNVSSNSTTAHALEAVNLGANAGAAAAFISGGYDPLLLASDDTLRVVQLRDGGFRGAASFSTLGLQNTSDTVSASNSGKGSAGRFFIANNDPSLTGMNVANALTASTIGFGRAARILIDNAGNDVPALDASTNGTGPTALFKTTAASNTSAVLIAEHIGRGPAATFVRTAPAGPPIPPLPPVVTISRAAVSNDLLEPTLRVNGRLGSAAEMQGNLSVNHPGGAGEALTVDVGAGAAIGTMTCDTAGQGLTVRNLGAGPALQVEGSGPAAPALGVHGIINHTGTQLLTGWVRAARVGVNGAVPTDPVKLAVCQGDAHIDGELRADTVTQADVTVCDYVFEPDYPLMPLDDLRAFVTREKHLPNVPSAAEVEAAGGIDLGGFQMRLLEKIEELRLYTLEQDQQISRQDERLARLEAENDGLRARLAAIETALRSRATTTPESEIER